MSLKKKTNLQKQDFDGDHMAVHEPLRQESSLVAQVLMLSTHKML